MNEGRVDIGRSGLGPVTNRPSSHNDCAVDAANRCTLHSSGAVRGVVRRNLVLWPRRGVADTLAISDGGLAAVFPFLLLFGDAGSGVTGSVSRVTDITFEFEDGCRNVF